MSPTKKQKTLTLLASIREELIHESFDAFIVGSGDAHQSEYVSENSKRLRFISSFSGSAGTALILQNEAFLWTDGRYFLQAEKELPEGWTLMKSGQPLVLDMNDWILANMSKGQTVGVDASLISTSEAAKMSAALKSAGISLKAATRNIVDTVWGSTDEGCPSSPKGNVFIHDIQLAGVTHNEKIEAVRECVRKASATAIVISMLDEVTGVFLYTASHVSGWKHLLDSYFAICNLISTQTHLLFTDSMALQYPWF